MSECTHDCSSCSQNCSSREIPKEKLNEFSTVKKVIGVVSGKGGVGKSMVTALSAVISQRLGFDTAVLDADITGPSIPKMFGVKEARAAQEGLLPALSATGVKIMSLNLLMQNETDPVAWRGPVIAGTVKQFWTDVVWGNVDYMFVDMPPGTGDVPLTVFQSLPVDGIIVVTSPQELVSMIVKKALNMANLMNIPVLGIVENMSYTVCPHCDEKIYLYGESHIEEIAEEYNTKVLGRIPIDPKLAAASDKGTIELFAGDFLKETEKLLEELAK